MLTLHPAAALAQYADNVSALHVVEAGAYAAEVGRCSTLAQPLSQDEGVTRSDDHGSNQHALEFADVGLATSKTVRPRASRLAHG